MFSQMKETKTVKGGPDCPTLLHYLARVLFRTDPSLVTFIQDLPHLEAAARGIYLPLTFSIASPNKQTFKQFLCKSSCNPLIPWSLDFNR